jgi:tRNA modification GTPase
VVLAGRPNAGKSSLLNALAGYDAAIVTEIPGTTRDLVREHIELDGLPVYIVDTAGLRDSAEKVEQEGVRRARQQLGDADHALIIVDANAEGPGGLNELLGQIPAGVSYTVVRNKIDLTGAAPGQDSSDANSVNVSALTGVGIDVLRQHIKQRVGFAADGEGTVTARRRHLDRLNEARKHFERGRSLLLEHRAGELMAEELLQVQNALAEITGEFTSDDLLGKIFGSFCIGK